MNLFPLMDLAAVLFDVLLLTLYLNVFLQRKSLSKPLLVLLYSGIIVLYYLNSTFLPEAYQRSLAYLVVCLLLTALYQGHIVYKSVLILIYAGLGILLENIMSFVLTICAVDLHLLKLGSMAYYSLGLLTSTLLFLAVILCILRPFQKNILEKLPWQPPLASSWNGLFLILLSITILMSTALDYLTLERGMENGLFFFLLLECLILAFDIAIFFIFKKMTQLQQENMYTALLKQQIQAQEAFYQQALQKDTQLKTLLHDEKNFLLGVIGALQEGRTTYALTEMQKKAAQLTSNITTYTGLLPLDNLLTVKTADAAQADIVLRPAIALYGTLPIDQLDLVVLLGNALDNAIHAASQAPLEPKREILLTMKQLEDRLLIEIRNPVKEKVPIKDHATVLTAKQDDLHGFGLATIARIVQKYDGALWLDCTDNTFTLKLYLENTPLCQNS